MQHRLARWTAALGVAAALTTSCGSKTGLFGVGGTPIADGGVVPGAPDADLPGAIPCVPGRFSFDLATAQIMFVIDRSGSMAFSLRGVDPAPPGEPTRWEILRDALAQTIVPFDRQIGMGAKFFPEPLADDQLGDSEASCRTDVGVGIAPASGNAQSILAVFDGTIPRGGTPTAEAIRVAAQYLAERRTVSRAIVLATDGAPNCNAALDALTCVCTTPRLDCARSPTRGKYSCLDDQRSIDAVATVRDEQKIPVYVIGIGSTENQDFLRVLDAMAIAGGRPRSEAPFHYNVQSAAELSSALSLIRDSVAKCTYLTPSSPLDPDAIQVEIAGAAIARDPFRQDGWDWVDQAYGELEFFGPACEKAQRASPEVSGVVSCVTK